MYYKIEKYYLDHEHSNLLVCVRLGELQIKNDLVGLIAL